MPAAVPIAAAVVPSLIGGIASNDQNKANQQNATNANNIAAQQQANASAQAYQQNQQGIAAALQRMQQYDSANPNPMNAAGAIKAPPAMNAPGGTIGGGTATGTGVQGGQNMAALVASLMKAAQAGSGHAATPAAAAAPKPATPAPAAATQPVVPTTPSTQPGMMRRPILYTPQKTVSL